ncbi:MAG: hypothetical protein UHP27_08180 [Muribaculaceae bacterium]|nr:hypothetical protein [Muribaculaceae bacterium]
MKHPVIIRCRLVPRRLCLNLFGTLWVRDPSWLDCCMINHERIHDAQQRELLWVPFYVIYVLEWLMWMVRYRNWDRAYRAISFEREAYANAGNLHYLATRRHYAQWRRQ